MRKEINGCEMCGGFPTEIHGRCHPTAPLRMVYIDGETMEVRCYIPDCDRLVAKFKVERIPEKAERALTKDESMTMPQEYFDAETDEEAGRIAQACLEARRVKYRKSTEESKEAYFTYKNSMGETKVSVRDFVAGWNAGRADDEAD